MAFAIGNITKLQGSANSAQLQVPAATGGTGPYTYQWYKSFTTGFTPGSAYLIPGATALTLNEPALLPSTSYFYVVVATDTGNGNVTTPTAQFTLATPAGSSQDPNQFQQTPILGMVTSSYNTGTRSALVDGTFSTSSSFPAGQAVKQVNPNGVTAGSGLDTLPHVVPVTANSDTVFGFAQYSMKDQTFVTSSPLEVSQGGNTQYLMATANGNAGAVAQLDITIPGGVQPVVGSSGATIVGTFIDQPVVGQLCRVALQLLPKTVA